METLGQFALIYALCWGMAFVWVYRVMRQKAAEEKTELSALYAQHPVPVVIVVVLFAALFASAWPVLLGARIAMWLWHIVGHPGGPGA